MYNTILFDLDGTLTDPGEGITNSVAYALDKFGITVSDRTTLYKFIGPPLVDSFRKYYGFTEVDADKAVVYYREYFASKGIFENKMYKGIDALLKTLKSNGKTVVLATSKPEPFAIKILKHFGLYEYFDFVAGATLDKTRNKKGDVIAYALINCNVTDQSTVLMVGDREQDINGAKQNGIDSLGVLFGYGSLDELQSAGATYIAETVNDILKFI